MSTSLDFPLTHNQRLGAAAAMWMVGRDSFEIARHLEVDEFWVWRNMEAIKLVAKQRKAA